MFLANPSTSSTANALFVGWGLLVGYDLFLTQDNVSEPLDIACNDAEIRDVWCPQGSLSDPIPFSRSEAGEDAGGEEARSPINYATAFVDLDWLYGRDEATSASLRTEDGGYMNMTDDELPHLLDDGTWLVSEPDSLCQLQERWSSSTIASLGNGSPCNGAGRGSGHHRVASFLRRLGFGCWCVVRVAPSTSACYST